MLASTCAGHRCGPGFKDEDRGSTLDSYIAGGSTVACWYDDDHAGGTGETTVKFAQCDTEVHLPLAAALSSALCVPGCSTTCRDYSLVNSALLLGWMLLCWLVCRDINIRFLPGLLQRDLQQCWQNRSVLRRAMPMPFPVFVVPRQLPVFSFTRC